MIVEMDACGSCLNAELLKRFCAFTRYHSTIFRKRDVTLEMNRAQWNELVKSENLPWKDDAPPIGLSFESKSLVFSEEIPRDTIFYKVRGKIFGRLFNLADG